MSILEMFCIGMMVGIGTGWAGGPWWVAGLLAGLAAATLMLVRGRV